MINNYVIMYGSAESIYSNLKEIQGKTPIEALKNAYNKDYIKVYGDESRYSDMILIRGTIKNNTLIYEGKGTRLCFMESEIIDHKYKII